MARISGVGVTNFSTASPSAPKLYTCHPLFNTDTCRTILVPTLSSRRLIASSFATGYFYIRRQEAQSFTKPRQTSSQPSVGASIGGKMHHKRQGDYNSMRMAVGLDMRG